jgi:hypothetical protein
MAKTIVLCGKLFDGLSDTIRGPSEILIEDDTISEVSNSVGRPGGAKVLDQRLNSVRGDSVESKHWLVSELCQLFEGCGVSEELAMQSVGRGFMTAG